MTDFLKRAKAFLGRVPCRCLFVVTALCLVLQENFPFSDFPMYGSFSNYTYVVYIAGGDDEPIPIESITSIRTGRLKKIYSSKLVDVRGELEAAGEKIDGFRYMTPEQCEPAGEYVLEWLLENCKEHAMAELYRHRPLRLHRVTIAYVDRKVETNDDFIATVE